MNKQSQIVGGATPLASSAPPTMKCRECNGKGEAEYIGLCDRYYRWATCHKCHGSKVEPLRCGTCEGTLTATGFCMACDDFEALTFVERIAPGRIAL